MNHKKMITVKKKKIWSTL